MTVPQSVLVIYGTRPEAIKLAPVIAAMGQGGALRPFLCVTAQHREMLDDVNEVFGLRPDHDLDLMQPAQGLAELTARAIAGLAEVLRSVRPAATVVQGDTTTAMCGALVSYYERIPVAHVEAGLRTRNIHAPFPEEVNRAVIARMARWNFAPTTRARDNLLAEGAEAGAIDVTGNTAVDAVLQVRDRLASMRLRGTAHLDPPLRDGERLVLLTAHRRESFGQGLRSIFEAVRGAVDRWPELRVVYPVHPNPNVSGPARATLGAHPRVHLTAPLGYEQFVDLLDRSWLVLTDSGGIQEEAPALHKPVLVLRDVTERPEAVEAGTALLVGTHPATILAGLEKLREDPEAYARMAGAANPFGDGRAAERIVARLAQDLAALPE